MSLPTLSPEVRADALAKAAAVRRERALVKEDLKKGRTDLPAILERADTDDVVARIKVIDILAALPGFAKIRAKNVMDELDIAESRRLRGLGANQRAALVERFQQKTN
ncbi:integration host factor, actinobacterial type [Prescottella agglutinans]|uniref:Integration host factor-like helix-two turn-helix domain-containing protein n=1 Tax=Prescottella agglutinans TaxID=1644129 RepID=A0ABT6MI40_9NOCA|nr:integration host factor, actinobacterial type [Prescottella agglutinans]MDH6283991.1 hypothetical protein [Prescottella agglutinans]